MPNMPRQSRRSCEPDARPLEPQTSVRGHMDLLFRASELLVLPIWALMILLPRWWWTARIIRSPLVSAAPAILYAALVLPRLGAIWPAVSRPTLPGVESLLGSPSGVTIAWVHFLAF